MGNLPVSFDKDFASKKILVTSKFNASLNIVWNAFTHPEILEKWFAPEPYKAITKTMDFQNDGRWLYYMRSPLGEKIWSVSTFRNIYSHKSFEASDAFCDENGVIDVHFPEMTWHYDFSEEGGETLVIAIISLSNEDDMKTLFEMGFEEGYKMALKQLQQLLE